MFGLWFVDFMHFHYYFCQEGYVLHLREFVCGHICPIVTWHPFVVSLSTFNPITSFSISSASSALSTSAVSLATTSTSVWSPKGGGGDLYCCCCCNISCSTKDCLTRLKYHISSAVIDNSFTSFTRLSWLKYICHIKSSWLRSPQTGAYCQHRESNISIQLELCFWPPDKCDSNAHSSFSSVLVFTSCWEEITGC